MAIEDAVVLADEVSVNRPVEESLLAVERLREGRVRAVMDTSRAILESRNGHQVRNAVHGRGGTREELSGKRTTTYIDIKLNEPYRSRRPVPGYHYSGTSFIRQR